MIVIGFGYRARQGKSTAALAALESCPLDTDVHLYAFADAVRMEVRLACAKFGGQYELIAAWQEAGLMPPWVHYEEPKPRSLLQWWGTDYRRGQDPDYWIKRLRRVLDAHTPDVAIITDVRFPNETAAIKEWGGTLVKVSRMSPPDVVVPPHESETALDAFDGWDCHLEAASVAEVKTKAAALYNAIVRGDDLRSCFAGCEATVRRGGENPQAGAAGVYLPARRGLTVTV